MTPQELEQVRLALAGGATYTAVAVEFGVSRERIRQLARKHGWQKPRPDERLVGNGHCGCGCGGRPSLARSTDRSRGLVGGKPRRFLRGHDNTHRAALAHPLGKTWLALRSACNTPGSRGFEQHGGSGVVVAERWDDFEQFAADVGDRPTARHKLVRRDNAGDFEPGNCRWVRSA